MSSRIYRPETVVRTVATVVPSANATVDISLPAGAYRLALIVTSSVTGTTTTVALHALNSVGTKNTLSFRGYEPDDSAPVALLTCPAGASVQYMSFVGHAGAAPADLPVALSNGLQVAIVKGGATTGEALNIELLATRIG